MSNKQYIYQISTNPINSQTSFLFSEAEDVAFSFVGDILIMTGMNDSVSKTIEAIKNSLLVYTTGEIDSTTFFELGLAMALDKKVYYVTDRQNNPFDAQLPYSLDTLIKINLNDFMELIDTI